MLTKEQVGYIRAGGGSSVENVFDLCDSHEALRGEVERLRAEVERSEHLAAEVGKAIVVAAMDPSESLDDTDNHIIVGTVLSLRQERDAALARAEQSEREVLRLRDALRVYANHGHWDNDDGDAPHRRCFVWLCHDDGADEPLEYGGTIAAAALGGETVAGEKWAAVVAGWRIRAEQAEFSLAAMRTMKIEAESELAEARRRAALDEAQCDEMTGMAGKLAERAEKAERELALNNEVLAHQIAQARKHFDRAERAESDLNAVEDILGSANGTHEDYRRGAAVASAEVARDRIAYLEESHRQACEEAEKRQDRAEQSERERDSARVRYCREVALRGWESAREVCQRMWPDAADSLFPVEVKP